MNKAQTVFEAIMRTKGHADFGMNGTKYVNTNLQVRWNYFQMGWEMRGVMV